MILAEFCHTSVVLLFSPEIVLKTSKISIANLDEFRFAHLQQDAGEMLRDVLASRKRKVEGKTDHKRGQESKEFIKI